MSKLEELRLDAEELKRLLSQAERQKVKDILSLDIRKIETEIITRESAISAIKVQNTPVITKPGCYEVKLTNYAWDQSDKFVKIYVTLKDVHTIPSENVHCDFTAKSMKLLVSDLNGKNHSLLIINLLHPISVEGSYTKVKTDMVVVFMKKKEASENWATVTVQDKKAKETKVPKHEPGEDPSGNLMSMMKQMYDEGDDEMKRTIAKAWTESRDKSTKEGFGGM